MSVPKWLQVQRRRADELRKIPRRIVLPMLPHEYALADTASQMYGRIWTIPEPASFGTLDPRQKRRKPLVAHGGRPRTQSPHNATSQRTEGSEG